MNKSRFVDKLVDPLIAFVLAAGYVALLLSTVKNLGYARDEGFYFHAAGDYKHWFDTLFTDPSLALEQDTVDRYWRTNHEHPAFVKSLFALSVKWLHGGLSVFRESGTAYRFPGMVLSSIGVATTYLWGRRAVGRLAGLVAALLLAFQPAIFYHSHLACFDVAVLTMWLVTTYAYQRSLDGGGLRWALLTGLLYGLELNTKHNAWLLPPALVVHLLITRGPRRIWRDLRTGRTHIPAALVAMALIGPVVFYTTWPWIWFDTGRRLAEWMAFHLNHEYYNMEFLGTTYFRPPMPRLYAWVMTLATVPTITLVLFVLGLVLSVRELPWFPLSRAACSTTKRTGAEQHELERRFSTRALWMLCLFTSYAPWLSSSTPIFGGTKHWITAYPFMCLFAGLGFDWALRNVRALSPSRLRELRVPEIGMALSVLLAPVVMTLHAHPWGLSAYMPIVGGTPGGASLGLNRSFWGYTTGAVEDYVNAVSPRNAQVYVHDTAMDSWYRYVKDGRIRSDLSGSLTLSSTDVALYHHEQHMARVEYQLWVDYGTVAPGTIGANDGVPIVWVYVRPKVR
jgi:4-amino-4-deoxy-L-arabinose transferase-like glycosyltransferase